MGAKIKSIKSLLHDVALSGCLGKSERQLALLKYLLTENEAGRGERIKAYSIALDVMERDEDFDNSIDSIVRVEMHRLRKNLSLFNARNRDYKIKIPKASYIPSIVEKSTPPAASIVISPTVKITAFILLTTITVVILLFGDFFSNSPTRNQTGCSNSRPNITVGITSNSTGNNLTMDSLLVSKTISSVIQQYQTFNLVTNNITCRNTPHYFLEHSLLNQEATFLVTISVKNSKTDQSIFNTTLYIQENSNSATSFFSQIVRTISDLVKPDGVLTKDAIIQNWTNHIAKQNLVCWVATYDAGILDRRTDFKNAQSCLESTIGNKSPYPESYALLAYLYLLDNTAAHSSNTITRQDTIENLLNQAHALGPKSFEVVVSQLFYEMRRSNPSNQKMRQLVNNIDTNMNLNHSAQLQKVIALGFGLGHWKAGRKSRDYLRTITAERDNSMLLFDVGYDLLYESPSNAVETARAQYSSNNVLSNLLFHAAANLAGNKEDAARTKKQLNILGLSSQKEFVENIKARRFEPKINARVIEGLQIDLTQIDIPTPK